ncbi:MAG TPA: hybrid sensor histidine kinase/response regulator [Kofleriaceae bacterium]|nr:hybrid sensor histidine kinase/response regulator [Kofleriaceae bacterium]
MSPTSNLPVLVFAPRGRDGELIERALTANGFATVMCTTPAELLEAMRDDAGCALITQEALDASVRDELAAWLSTQPPWSDFPLLVLLSAASPDTLESLSRRLGNITFLERPLAPATLLTATRSALRGRMRQLEARSAIQQRDQFLAMLGHELRNPLAAIVLAARLVREGSDRSQLGHRVEVIERQSNILARLVDDLLDVARVTSGKVRLRSEAVDVDAVIRSCIEAHEERAKRRNMQIVFTSASNVTIEGDTVRIEQVVSNLLANAVKYSPAGRTVRISSKRLDDACEIRVRDEGIGIAPEMQSHVFDLFTQIDSSADRSEGGMGIGLTLVDRLVRLHGGTIDLVSDGLGTGSEFIVRLPIGVPPVDPSVLKLEPAIAAQKIRVVLVEDNADLRELSAEMLEALGCSVEVAVDGPEGVERICSSHPDLALVDIGLPLLDGFGVARQVRERIGREQMLVAVTGYGREQDREQAQAAGFDLHVTKPLAADTLKGLIERARARRTRSAASGS